MDKYCRPLNTLETASHFLQNVLEVYPDRADYSQFLQKIIEEESIPMNLNSTMDPVNRVKEFMTEEQRNPLRYRIIDEMINNICLENDDDVCLGAGGGLPSESEIKAEKKAIFVMGLPASGKSGVCSSLCNLYGAFLMDSDLVKRKLPEYKRKRGASRVHDEASKIMFVNKYGKKSIFQECMNRGYNMCIPKIGSKESSVLDILEILKGNGYSNYILLVSLEREKATRRAFNRYLKTKRYVSLGLIFDGYANDPILCYYRLRQYLVNKDYSYFDGMAAITTDVQQGDSYPIKDQQYATSFLQDYLQTL